jgi:LmbE family N-acetylglucosaminyl deacetylase
VKIMAVGAHPDDIEILAAGTLAKYGKQGHDVAMCVMTDGSLGSDTGALAEIAQVRRGEAEESASLIGAGLYWIGRPDGLLIDDRQTRSSVAESLRHFAPDLILAHAPDDYHPDHRAAGLITLACRQLATAPLFRTESPALAEPPQVVYMDNVALAGSPPEVWVDISSTIETKRQMLRCHRSQNEWLRDLKGSDYLDFLNKQAGIRGLQCGVEYAEGFRRAHVFPATPADLF